MIEHANYGASEVQPTGEYKQMDNEQDQGCWSNCTII